MKKKINILFLCTGNSCRSQMAEGWARHLKGEILHAESAGVATHGLNPYAVQVMAEAGVDIAHQQSTLVDDLLEREWDYVVTLCGHAHESCPMFPRQVTKIHVGFDDPAQLAKAAASEEETLAHFRRVRDEIRAFVVGLPDNLSKRP